MDVLTDVLNSVHLSGEVICRFELTSPWGISIPEVDGASFHVIDRGSCWIRLKDGGGFIPLAGGDLVVFPKGTAHEVVDSHGSLSPPLEELICELGADSRVLHHGGGGSPTTVICGVFNHQDAGDHPLLSLLPPLIHIKGDQGQAVPWLDFTLKFIGSEAGSPLPGSDRIVSLLTEVIFVHAVRAWIMGQADSAPGWLTALRDTEVGAALGHIHRAPGRPWTVESLGAEVGMSRSAFAARFSALVGEPPLRYVTRWRMRLASTWLRDSGMGLAEIAARLGYQSEDPFKRAFKREIGTAPGAYRRHARATPKVREAEDAPLIA